MLLALILVGYFSECEAKCRQPRNVKACRLESDIFLIISPCVRYGIYLCVSPLRVSGAKMRPVFRCYPIRSN